MFRNPSWAYVTLVIISKSRQQCIPFLRNATSLRRSASPNPVPHRPVELTQTRYKSTRVDPAQSHRLAAGQEHG
jgi:hypothetical protein